MSKFKLLSLLAILSFVCVGTAISSEDEPILSDAQKAMVPAMKARMLEAKNGVSHDGNTIDTIGRSSNAMQSSENSSEQLGDPAKDINFSSKTSIQIHSNNFKNTINASDTEEGRAYRLLNTHKDSQEYRTPNTNTQSLVDDMTLTNQNAETNPFLDIYNQMESGVESGTVCRTVDPGSTTDTRNIKKTNDCSELTGALYMESSCKVEREIITPGQIFNEYDSKQTLGDTTEYRVTTNGEGYITFTASEVDLTDFDLDIETPSNSVVVLLNNQIIRSYGQTIENPGRFLIDGENNIRVYAQDSHWETEPWDFVDGALYVCKSPGHMSPTKYIGVKGKTQAYAFFTNQCRDGQSDDFLYDFMLGQESTYINGQGKTRPRYDMFDLALNLSYVPVDTPESYLSRNMRLKSSITAYVSSTHTNQHRDAIAFSAPMQLPGVVKWGEASVATTKIHKRMSSYRGTQAHSENFTSSAGIKCTGTMKEDNVQCIYGAYSGPATSSTFDDWQFGEIDNGAEQRHLDLTNALNEGSYKSLDGFNYVGVPMTDDPFYNKRGSTTWNYPGSPVKNFGFIPLNFGITSFAIRFTNKKLFETITETPAGCITQPDSLTVDVVGGPILNGVVGRAVPQPDVTNQPHNLSNDTWVCTDSDVGRTGNLDIPVVISVPDYQILTEMYPGEKNDPQAVCYKAEARKYLVEVNNVSPCDDGTFSCYGSHFSNVGDGTTLDIAIDSTSSCRKYIDDPSCLLIDEKCEVTDTFSGGCAYKGFTYECSGDVSVTTPSPESGVVCSSPIPCLGEDSECNDTTIEASSSFGQAAGMMTAATMVSQEGDCAGLDPDSCILFGGEKTSCRSVVSVAGLGKKDCCENPTDFTTGDMIMLAIAVSQTEYFKSLQAQVVSAVSESVATAWAEYFAEQATEAAIEAATEQAISSAAESSAASAAGASTVATSSTMSTIGSAVSVVGTIYTTYVIAKALYDAATTCNTQDFDVSFRQATDQCIQYDTACTERTWAGDCATRRTYYCCYNSAFAKHLNKEIYDKNISGRQLVVNPAQCEGFTFEELGQLDWSQITLEGWVDTLYSEGLIPASSQEAIGGVSPEGNPYTEAQEANGVVITKSGEMTPEEFFAEDNMADLVGQVAKDPDAATASVNAEEKFEPYENSVIEVEREITRQELLLDNLYTQNYEVCGYDNFTPLNYSIEKLQRFVYDDEGERIDREDCRVYEDESKAFLHRFDMCSVSWTGSVYVASMNRYFMSDVDGRQTVETCTPQPFPVEATACGYQHDIPGRNSYSAFSLTMVTGVVGDFPAQDCGFAQGDSITYPHYDHVCGTQKSPPNMLISRQTLVNIEGNVETMVSCHQDEIQPLVYEECGLRIDATGTTTLMKSSFLLDGAVVENNDCGYVEGVSYFVAFEFESCGLVERSDGYIEQFRPYYIQNGSRFYPSTCADVEGLSIIRPYSYEQCGVDATTLGSATLFHAFYIDDGVKKIHGDCGVVAGYTTYLNFQYDNCATSYTETTIDTHVIANYLDINGDKQYYGSCGWVDGQSESSPRGLQYCGVEESLSSETVLVKYRREGGSDFYSTCGNGKKEQVSMDKNFCGIGPYPNFLYEYSLSYTIGGSNSSSGGGEIKDVTTCDTPSIIVPEKTNIKTERCGRWWGARKKYADFYYKDKDGQIIFSRMRVLYKKC